MLAKVLLSLFLWLRFAAGQDTPEPGAQPPISSAEGDLLFLLDSSASVSHYEFSKVKEFMWDLLHPFTFGPRDVQTSIIHISTTPTMEFPFDQYLSSGTVRKAIRDTRQLMGDTNTGKALSYAKEKLFSGEAGARPGVPKVLVWVTDGFSTDDISEPMQLLKDMGVTVFIVSTGRGNFLELSAAASQPSDKHLHFVDVDDLPIITKELRDGILGVMRATRLHATDVTSSSFRLVWPRLLSQDSGYYSLEYGPSAEPARRSTQQLPAALGSLVLSHLAPETTYEVALTPESNVHYFPTQTTSVTTLPEEISPVQVLISDSGPRSFHVSWAPVLDSVASYQVLYGPLPGNSVKVLQVDGRHNSTVVKHLAPNTTYLVTVTAIYRSGKEKSLSAKACTQEEGSRVRHLRFEEVGADSLRASWDPAEGAVRGYRVRCRRRSGRSSALSVAAQVHSVLLSDLPRGSSGSVCVQPVYSHRPGSTLCRTVRRQPATEAQGYGHGERHRLQ
ncbi:von Willebrand factor A domain-containing protein 1 [Lonchura striata]|uniref:von Willebrand factor A domain-containing protein 1 n=2 Tax=Lonchura striata TaxID=40157 RepID=A0A218UPT6_9PASE|nr:von Willebrand factor A domain-containing protein 1 isoform X1 [Lonchura striata domestica]OWK55785.1 von Willebrand factor A domain-containing protein 1 [Lonchura striata domestica]